jgi:hypothetical protein
MKKTNEIADLIQAWRNAGPVAWSEGEFGWIDIDGRSPVKLTDWQRAALNAWFQERETVTTFAVSNVKKSGKTFTNAILTAWRWLALPGVHFCVANDLDQATSRQFQEIADMVRRHPFLRDQVKVSAKVLEFTPTGSTLLALAGDAAGNAGANFLTVSHTEAWGILYEQDVRNFEELTTPPGRFYGLPALRIVDSYAGYLDESQTWHSLVDRGLTGEQLDGDWPIFREGGLLLFHIEGEEGQKRCYRGTPEEAKVYYKDQRATLRENTYKRLHENRRMPNVGTFVDDEVWQSLVDKKLQPLPAGSDRPVYIGLDIAVAPGGDNCALIGVYYDHGQTKVAFHKVWKGGRFRLKKLNLSETVEPYILGLNKKYKIQGVYFDPWQAVYLADRLRVAGIYCVEVRQTHSSRGPKDTALFEMVSNGQLSLYDDPDLRTMAQGASAKELGDGRLFLQKTGGRSKIDLLVALSNCADVCNAEGLGVGRVRWLPNIITGPYEGLSLDDFMFTPDGNFEYAPDRNRAQHKPGVTWRNCRMRNRGCEACVRELEQEGWYDFLEEEANQLKDVEPMSPEEAIEMFWQHFKNKPITEVKPHVQEFIQAFLEKRPTPKTGGIR